MKSVFFCAALCLPLLTVAQDLSDIDPATVDAITQQAQKIQACMARIDQSAVEQLQTEADAKATEIRTMCANGERGAAQSEAVDYGKQLVDEPVVIEAKACLGMGGLAIPQTTWAQLEDSETAQTHVCDL